MLGRPFLRIATLALFVGLVSPQAALAAPAAAIPACPLLTIPEVTAALGVPVEAVEQEPSGGGEGEGRMTTCLWTPVGGRLGSTLSLVVWSWPPGDYGAAGFLEALRAYAKEDPDRPVETLPVGDDALWDGDRVYVRKGDVNFTLATSLNALDPTPDARRKLEALAGLVAERL